MTQEFKYFITTCSEWNGQEWQTVTRIFNSSVVEDENYNLGAGESFTDVKPTLDSCDFLYDLTHSNRN